MIETLRRWLRHADDGEALTRDQSGRLMRRATSASVAVATTLIVAKVIALAMTGSVSVLSSLIDSSMDVLASLINFFAVRHALQPADREHRFGHGKAEPLAALGQAAFIAGSAVFLAIEAGARLLRPRPIDNIETGIAVMALSIVLTLALVGYQRYVVRKTGSTAIQADALHYETDLLINGSVIVALALSRWLDWRLADPLFGGAIALYLLRAAWLILRRAFDLLMDREFVEAERARIREIVLSHPEVKGMHDLRTRSSGIQPFIQFHLELDGAMSLYDAHVIADQVEIMVKKAYPGAEVIIHQDPEGIVEERARFA